MWLESIKLIDLDEEALLIKAIFIGHITNGGIGYRDLLGLQPTVLKRVENQAIEFGKKIGLAKKGTSG